LAKAAAVALTAALALTGCSVTEGPADVEGPVTVYVSLPLSGPRAADGRDAADGARLALEEAEGKAGDLEVESRFLDDARRGRAFDLVAVGANARRAASDSSTAAYVGELDSSPTRTSLPILNDAGIAQVSPGATAADLTEPVPGDDEAPERYRPSGRITFARVIPDDEVLAAARARVAASSVVEPAIVPRFLPRRSPELSALFRDRFDRPPGPYAAYGYEAMSVVLDAIESRDTGARDFRSAVVDELLQVERPDSVLGPYSFSGEGDTTLCEVQPYRETARAGLVPERPVCGSG
jgi:ABC-type branched-subunit amino acid transport system substrate-binding protein